MHGTIIRNKQQTNTNNYMRDSACSWLIFENTKKLKFVSYAKHF